MGFDGACPFPVRSIGDVQRPIFPRSAVKVLQALALVESGAADRLDLGDDELALACASHGGEPMHTQTAARMLEKAGLGIAFHAKQKLREAADTSISTGGLDSILYLLGISARELEEVLSMP